MVYFSLTRSHSKRVREILKLDAQVRDKCGRLLAYVYLDDQDRTFLNAKLVQDGYAVVMMVPPNVKHSELFLKLQREARRKDRGLWALEKSTTTMRNLFEVSSRRDT